MVATFTKYPRTWHLPWSPGLTRDDRKIPEDLLSKLREKEIIVTEKLDGENSTCYSNYLHARSLDGRSHLSRSWLKGFHSEFNFKIHSGMRVCGENVYAQHTIHYDSLPSYFMVFSIWQDSLCLSWDETVEWCEELNLSPVLVLYRGPWDEKKIKDCWTGVSQFGSEQEGYVVRPVEGFLESEGDFLDYLAKYVRENHVQTNEHWMNQPVIPNGLRGTNE